MLKSLRHLLTPPVFPNDEDKTRAARHTHFITLAVIGFIIVYEAWIKLTTRRPINSFDLGIFGLLVLFIIVWALLKSGMVRLSAGLLVAALWLVSNIIPAFGYGIRDSTFIANFVVVVISSLLLGWQASLAFGLLTALSAFGLVYLEQRGFLPVLPAYPSQVLAQDLTLMLLLSVVSLYFLSSGLLASLRKTRNVLNELSVKNREMDRIQSDLRAQSARLDELNRINLGRATQLKTIIQIVHDIAALRETDELLRLTAALLRERFDYDHVGIYLLEENGEFAVLRAASGVDSAVRPDEFRRINVGAADIIGTAAASGEIQTVADRETQTSRPPAPVSPLARSETALPLRSRGRILGVLHIQARAAAAFSPETVEVLQLFAEQFVTTLENVELVQRLETTLDELNTVYRSQTRQAWEKSIQERGEISLEYDGLQVRPVTQQLPDDIVRRLKTGRPVILEENRRPRTLIVPLMVLQQMVGAIGLQQENPGHAWTDEEIALAETIANRAALALENARLLEEAQRRAAKERRIGEISARIGSLVDIDNIVQTTIQELSQMMPGTDVAVQFHSE